MSSAELEGQRDNFLREKQLIRSESPRRLSISNNIIGQYITQKTVDARINLSPIVEGNQGDVFKNLVGTSHPSLETFRMLISKIVSMGGSKYLLPFLSPLSPLDQLEQFLSSPYIPLSLLTRLSFPGRRGGRYTHTVCVAESGTGLTFLRFLHLFLH
jgi:hypothetical protein